MSEQVKIGRELDALIAKHVFGSEVEFLNQQAGWRIDYRAKDNNCNNVIMTDYGSDGYRLKYYSTDIKAAWQVVEKTGILNDFFLKFGYDSWMIGESDPLSGEWHLLVEGETAPHAICLAALKAVNK